MWKYKAFSENWCEGYKTLNELKKDLINWSLEVGEKVQVRDKAYELCYEIEIKENNKLNVKKIY